MIPLLADESWCILPEAVGVDNFDGVKSVLRITMARSRYLRSRVVMIEERVLRVTLGSCRKEIKARMKRMTRPDIEVMKEAAYIELE